MSGAPRTILYTSLNTTIVIASGSGSGIGGVQNGEQDYPWCATVIAVLLQGLLS